MGVAVRALSVDGELLDHVFARPFAARVHSVFDHAVNVQDGTDLITLTTGGSDDSPRTLVVTANSFAQLSLTRATRVTVRGSSLSVGGLVVDFGQARRWQPVLPEWAAHPGLVRDLERLVYAEGTGDSMRTDGVLRWTTRAFEGALAVEDLDSAAGLGTRLIGLGGGLTPAGDDYLVGMCTALALPGEGWQPHRRLLARIIADNVHRTNDISSATLLQAARGRVRQTIIDVVRSLATGEAATLPGRVRRLLAIGHTSGSDIAAGLLGGVRLRMEEAAPDGSTWVRQEG